MLKAVKEFNCLRCECYYCAEKNDCTRKEWCEIWKCRTQPKACFKSSHEVVPFKGRIKKAVKGIKEYEQECKHR